MVLAADGLNHCGAYGVSDHLAMEALQNPVSVPDAFATVLAAMKIDQTTNLCDGDRPVPTTDRGQAIEALPG